MLHQRRVPFLLVSLKCNTHCRHSRTRSRLSSANNVAALCVSGANRSSGCFASNHSGAPVGFRLALKHPERITAIISQNGNAYEEGLSESWNPIQKYWQNPTAENRAALRAFLAPEATKWQYVHGVQDETLVAPEAYTLDSALLARPGNDEIQLDLFLDYASNVALYPKFQEYFRTNRPPLLAVWGKNDPFFLQAGAEGFRRDNPSAEVDLYDTGHFALETHYKEIAGTIQNFLDRKRSLGHSAA
jgi:pimeloyl-ACP methyl ester carboxylesterase